MALKKQEKSKTREAKNRAADDAAVDIELDSAALLKGKGKPKNGLALSDGEDSDQDEEFETGPSHVPKAFKQRDLVAQAFAGDNVIEVSKSSDQALPMLNPLLGLCCGKAESDGGRRSSRRGYYSRWLGKLHVARTVTIADSCHYRGHGVARASRRTGTPRSLQRSSRVSTPPSVKTPAKPTSSSTRKRTRRPQSICSRIFRTRIRVPLNTKQALLRPLVRIGMRLLRISVQPCRALRKR